MVPIIGSLVIYNYAFDKSTNLSQQDLIQKVAKDPEFIKYFGENLQSLNTLDTDSDGTPDFKDNDDDNDGTADSADTDDDNDGTADSSDPSSAVVGLVAAAQEGVTDGPLARGADGEDGEDGQDGRDGIDGQDGTATDGTDGTGGVDGSSGTDGTSGGNGADGSNGLIGPAGPKGDKGDKGDTGATGATGTVGVVTDDGVVKTSLTGSDLNIQLILAAGSGLEKLGGGLTLKSTCASNEILKWTGSAWNCAADDGGITYSAGSGITISSGVISSVLGSSIETAELANSAVTSTKLADGSVLAAKIVDGEIITAKIADAAVTTDKIANNGVTTTKIIDSAVTFAKIQALAGNSLFGNPTGSSATGTNISLGSGLSFSAGALQNAGLLTVSVVGPIQSTGGQSPTISIVKADGLTDGYLSATDFAAFAAKQAALPSGLSTQYVRGDQTLGTLDTTAVAENGNLYFTNGRADGRITIQKGVAGGLATLDGTGKIPTSQLPALTITNTYVVADQTAMLALSANQGDVAVRYDNNKSYILVASPASVLANWQELLTPGAPVLSVNGLTGTITLTSSDITEGTNLYYTDARARASLSVSGPLTYDNGTGIIGVTQASGASSGYLSATDFNTFSNKQNTLPVGTANQYFRGDQTLATLNTTAVPEGTNLYYTEGRFDTSFGGKTTDNLTEGLSNVYFTQSRFDSALALKSTTNLAEGTNLYFTTGRFDSALAAKTTDDLSEGTTNKYFTDTRADGRITIQKGVAGGIATLDGSGKIPTSQLPATVVNDTYVVGSQSAMLALSANKGDVAVRTDTSESYILSNTPATTLGNWVKLLNPTSPVLSVNGQTGAVNLLTTNIAEGTNLYYTDARARGALSVAGPLTYNSTTGLIGLTMASTSTNGYLSFTDWNTFNAKQDAITAGPGITLASNTISLTNQGITFAIGSSGTDVNWSGATVNLGGTATINIPSASGTARGLVSTGAQTFAGDKTFSGALAVARGSDFSTVGTNNDVNFGSTSLVRLTGASAQSITGIAGGTDGRVLTIINAGSQTATLANQSASSAAANRIITGTGANLTLASDASINLVYDSGASRWRVVGGTGSGSTTTAMSKRVGEFVYAESGRSTTDGYLAVSPGTITNGAVLYPTWAAKHPEFVSGSNIVFPSNVAGMFMRNVGGNAAAAGTFQSDSTALPNNPFTTNTAGDHSHSSNATGGIGQPGLIYRSGGGNNTFGSGDTTFGEPDLITNPTGLSINSAGAHSHTVNAGGDAETRPDNRAYQLYTLIDTYTETVGGNTSMSAITAALAINALDNTSFTQTWNWNNATTQDGLVLGATSLTDGSLLNLNNTSTSNSGLTLNAKGSVAYQRGSDFSTVGVSNDVNFGNTSLVRLTGGSAQTITGVAGGDDGELLTIINAGSIDATLANESASSSAANRIITGTGSNLSLAASATISLVYDSGASRWRVIGGTGSGGGGSASLAIDKDYAFLTFAGTPTASQVAEVAYIANQDAADRVAASYLQALTAYFAATENDTHHDQELSNANMAQIISTLPNSAAWGFAQIDMDNSVAGGSQVTTGTEYYRVIIGSDGTNIYYFNYTYANNVISTSPGSSTNYIASYTTTRNDNSAPPAISATPLSAPKTISTTTMPALTSGIPGLLRAATTGVYRPYLSGAGSPVAVSINSIESATANGTLNNANFTQNWNWNTATTQDGLVLGATSMTSGDLLVLNNTSTDNTGLTLNAKGSVAFQKGGDFSTVGVSNDVNFGNTSLVRLTGASAQTITGIAGGSDGELLTIMNTASQSATISNQNTGSVAANRIITGTGTDLSLAADATLMLQYDATSSRWRVVGGTGGSGSANTTQSLSSSGAASSWNSTIYVDSSAGSVTVTLPAAATNAGKRITVIKTSSDSNAVTIDPNASETINGTATYSLWTPYGSSTVESNGTNVLIVQDAQESYVAASYLTANKTTGTNLTTATAVDGDSSERLFWNSVDSQFGTDISLDTSTGVFTLKGGKTYRVKAKIERIYTGAANTYIAELRAVNSATALGRTEVVQSSASFGSQMGLIETVVSPSVDTKYMIYHPGGWQSSTYTPASSKSNSLDIEVIAGNARVTGQTVDYSYGSLSGSGLGSPADLNMTALSGNMTVASNSVTLLAGKTYMLEATLNCGSTGYTGTTVCSAIWVNASNATVGSAAGSVNVLSQNNTNNQGTQPITKTIFTPSTNVAVHVRATANNYSGGWAVDGSSYYSITQVGSTSATGLAFSSLSAAIANNSLDNTNFAQTWNWSTGTSQTGLTLNAGALTTGTIQDITTNSGSLNSTNGLLRVANLGASTSGVVFRAQSNSTSGSGLTVLANGNVGIGTASPNNTLYVNGSSTIQGNMSIAVGSASVIDLAVGDNDTGLEQTSDGQLEIRTNGGTRFRFTTGNGGGYASYDGDGNIDFSSDRRLKHDIEDSSPVLDRVLGLKVKRFYYNGADETNQQYKSVGLIAQEVLPLFPELVGTQYNEELGDSALTVAYTDFATIALQAIQELNMKVDGNKVAIDGKQLDGLTNLQKQVDTLTAGLTVVQGNVAEFSDALSKVDMRIADLDARLKAMEAGKVAGASAVAPQNTTINNTTIVEDKNQLGEAKISKGKIGVKVTFAKKFDVTPMVYITPTSGKFDFELSNVTVDGFTIKMSDKATADISFNWLAAQRKSDVTTQEEIDGPAESSQAPASVSTGQTSVPEAAAPAAPPSGTTTQL